jgi:hypothetical protein
MTLTIQESMAFAVARMCRAKQRATHIPPTPAVDGLPVTPREEH